MSWNNLWQQQAWHRQKQEELRENLTYSKWNDQRPGGPGPLIVQALCPFAGDFESFGRVLADAELFRRETPAIWCVSKSSPQEISRRSRLT
jgi:hypothetical protein